MPQTRAQATGPGSPEAPHSPGPSSAPAPPVPLSRARRALRAVAVVSCLPYMTLKSAWVAGSHVGIPEGSSLLEHNTTLAVANGIGVLLDAVVVVLALLFTRPWGLRVPAWLLVFPMWVATGLLTPIMAGYPLQLLVKAVGGTVNRSAGEGSEPFLHEWVFGMVYTGFIVQGLALGALFVLYARDRWGHLWQGRVHELPVSRVAAAQRATAVAAAVLALLPATMHALWACGGTAGLAPARIADRTSDFYVLEISDALFLAAAVAGGWLLAFRRVPRAWRVRTPFALPVKVPLALAWTGSGALTCWGGWLSMASLGGVDDLARRPSELMNLTYSVQMIVGILVASVGTHFLAERAGSPAP
ncbi:hypothetical protein ACIQNU_07680 [Streptomyces sp. NPDC091292]|uniref:hypothetical protein n=1 Tax=Streptomyces sp. NPDC091292 TaxID=3365991 RepID=UPI00382CA938